MRGKRERKRHLFDLEMTYTLFVAAEAVGASTKERASRDAIFNYGRELKAEAGSLRELAQTLAQTPAIGQTVETKQSVINSLFKIGKLTANLMQGELQRRLKRDTFMELGLTVTVVME